MDIQKILTRIRKYNRNIITYIKLHIKEFEITCGIIMATIGISVGLSYILPESVMAKTNIQKYEILKAMTEMDDIAHQQRETVINALGSGYNMQRDRLFQVIDNEYHKTKNIDDKILAAEKFHELMIQENELLQKIGKGNPDQIKKCDQLQKEMDQIINN